MADSKSDEKSPSPTEGFLEMSRTELTQVRNQTKEIALLVEQSQGEVDKLVQRNASITAQLHQIQSNFDTVPREDIRTAYEAAQDTQQRLFTMRGQVEKLQSDLGNLKRYSDYLAKTVQLLEGGAEVAPGVVAAGGQGGEIDLVQKLIEAQEDERRKISRQIHDGPAQSLSNFILQTEIALRLFDSDSEKAREELSSLKAAAATTFSQIRDYIFDLRPMMLDDLGLVPTVRRYTEAFKDKTGLNLNLVVTGSERRLESHLEVLLFRAVQELLGNVREYAQATQVKVTVDMDDAQVRATVEDNGRGFDPDGLQAKDGEGRGLLSLRDRVAQASGSMEFDASGGKGSRIVVIIPTDA
ncbi:MAG: Histidine kinase protein [Anaerolineales bacterium]|jgi:two-component system sensor histidine kinase DegS|nr:Histidine kinase protein [Anaerolineales bacterium]